MLSRKSASFTVLPRFRMWSLLLTLSTLSLMMSLPAHAGFVAPTSYDMIGGGTSSLNTTLWDEPYPQTSNYQALSGRLGELTDGIVATGNWDIPGPYVGWKDNSVASPTIKFHFDSFPVSITKFGIHFNSWYRPSSVDITDGVNSYNFAVPYQGGHEWIDFSSVNLTGNLFTLKLNNDTSAWNKDWIMISEVRFEGCALNPVPIPPSVILFGSGLLGLVGVGRKFKKL